MSDKNLYEVVIDALPAGARHRRAWMSLVRCFSSIESILMRFFAKNYNSSLPRYDVLTALAMHPDGWTMGELSELLMVSKGNVTGVIRRLEEDELVIKKTSSVDRRVQSVRISAQGRRLWDKMHADYDAIISSLMKGQSVSDLDALVRVLDQARDAVESNAPKIDAD